MSLFFKKNYKRKRYGSIIYGTLTSPDVFSYIGDVDEREKILDFIENTSRLFLWCILGVEKNLNSKIHYNFIVKYKQPVSYDVCDKMYTYFNNWSGSDDDKILFGTKCNVIKYVAKGGVYNTRGDISSINIDSIISRYKKKEEMKKICENEGIEFRNEVWKEVEIIEWLNFFMKSKNYSIDYDTRDLINTTKNDFFNELHENNFHLLFGIYGIEMAEEHIDRNIFHDLPITRN